MFFSLTDTTSQQVNNVTDFSYLTMKRNNREEQIEETRHKPQWIVSQGHSHTYNSRIQLSRLQRIYQPRRLAYD